MPRVGGLLEQRLRLPCGKQGIGLGSAGQPQSGQAFLGGGAVVERAEAGLEIEQRRGELPPPAFRREQPGQELAAVAQLLHVLAQAVAALDVERGEVLAVPRDLAPLAVERIRGETGQSGRAQVGLGRIVPPVAVGDPGAQVCGQDPRLAFAKPGEHGGMGVVARLGQPGEEGSLGRPGDQHVEIAGFAEAGGEIADAGDQPVRLRPGQQRPEQGGRGPQPPEADPRLVHRLGVVAEAQGGLVAAVLLQAVFGDEREGFGESHAGMRQRPLGFPGVAISGIGSGGCRHGRSQGRIRHAGVLSRFAPRPLPNSAAIAYLPPMARTPAGTPHDPRGASRFNEDQASTTLRGSDQPDIDRGLAVLRETVKTLPARPGVYRMQDARGDVLYVGKARVLRNRVANYVQVERLSTRLKRMVSQTRELTIVTTNSEAEALLLEAQLIKRFRPPYNVLLRDDKSFPFILLRADHAFPRITKHRGARKAKGNYYGPFASAGSVNTTINALQKLFLLRSCTDSFFSRRDRPCLLYQIKRCSAPCVGRIDEAGYGELVQEAKDFLGGRSSAVQRKIEVQMHEAAEGLDFERAAMLRDRLRAATFIQGSQAINAAGLGDADIFAMATKAGQVAVQAFFIRGGQNWGHRAFFPTHTEGLGEEEVLTSFLAQFYEEVPPARCILVDRALPEGELLAEAFRAAAGGKVEITVPQRGDRRRLIEQATRNAREALDRRLAESGTQARTLRELAEFLELPEVPQRIEIYDNSHIQGTNALGAMVVAGPEGFIKGQYRKFNIKRAETAPGDDFAMMREVMARRFGRAVSEDPQKESGTWPDLVLIDGGKGQMSAVRDVVEELGVEDLPLVAVSKGPDRNAGREVFHFPDGREKTLPLNSPVLFYLQRLRDEAHRFAIGAHRQKRSRAITASPLDEIPGIGPARKRALLLHFGTAGKVRAASLEDLQRAPGVSAAVAQAVYDFYHPAG